MHNKKLFILLFKKMPVRTPVKTCLFYVHKRFFTQIRIKSVETNCNEYRILKKSNIVKKLFTGSTDFVYIIGTLNYTLKYAITNLLIIYK